MNSGQEKLLLVDDEEDFLEVIGDHLQDLGLKVIRANTGAEALLCLGEQEFDLILVDLKLPDQSGLDLLRKVRIAASGPEVVVLTGHATIETAVEAMRLGALDYLSKPVHLDELDVVVRKALNVAALRGETQRARQIFARAATADELIGNSPALGRVLEAVGQVAPTATTVLIQGETGTGKELVAKAIHRAGPRRERPFVAINCAALQETLIEGELFGHEKGAYTGAHEAQSGLLEVARGGTLFIDEVSEMSLACQARFLRVLETGEFRRVGGTQTLRSDFRVIAATNRHLDREVKAGRFREDLFYRLNVYGIQIPPLRERREDIPLLVRHWVRGKDVDPDAISALMEHPWPGNVRELRNAVERALIAAGDAPTALRAHFGLPASRSPVGRSSAPLRSLAELESDQIAITIQACQGNKRRSAKILGISLRNLYRKLERYGLDLPAAP